MIKNMFYNKLIYPILLFMSVLLLILHNNYKVKTMNQKSTYLALLFSIFICFSLKSYSQLTVNVGKDTTYCTKLYRTEIPMGLKVNIQNGVAPYTYAWECTIVPYGILEPQTASDILNDSTLISPKIKDEVGLYAKQIKLKLHVTDHAGNTAMDSINVRFSVFGYLDRNWVIELNKGDSILFIHTTIGGGIEPLTFKWQPRTGLSNPDNLVTWAKPEVSTEYEIIATDSCGCVSEPNLVYDVKVITTNVEEFTAQKENSLNIRQNGKHIYFNNPLRKESHITVYTLNGTAKSEFIVMDDHFAIENLLDNKGFYFVKISVDNHSATGKFFNP